ncbi:ankyrin repeat protein [Seminavis robusta]|uniref:Ankyrin repeat protein n=1 Tax=Seminavis robusta TaxID=568900 RepID=A0A9N8H527_9STRA|nr:ankyrin repeat protein [Seminavis robusta]|eukprot:Sro131_g062250.1 ankyrin repeat protein (332) ;mRNA; r:46015-47010
MSSDTGSIGTGASTGGADAAAIGSAINNKKQKMSPPIESLLLDKNEIWIQGILPLVGVGQYAFVGAVNKKMNQLYKEYCKIELEKNPRKVKDGPPLLASRRSAEITDTLYSETFCNLPRAEYWLKDNSSRKNPSRHLVCNAIAIVGNLTVMQWARQQGFPWHEYTSIKAAKHGHLEMLQWLRENGCPWDRQTCKAAAKFGHLEILKWAHENGCPWNEKICEYAAINGHFEILKWARENGCPWNEQTCAGAARRGQLEILKWARANGCPWNEKTCEYAAEGGRLEVLKWARANGCPWDRQTCEAAAKFGHLEILKWARENVSWNAWTCMYAL